MVAVISAFFGLLGLALAGMGVYGVASNNVAQRTRELGIRRALGASGWSVIRESLSETLVVVVIGLAAGFGVASLVVRYSASLFTDMLFGISAADAGNFIAAVGVMVAAAILACTLPAIRAARVDPLAVIRDE